VPEAIASIGHADALHSMGNPYPDPELQKILSRKYKIADIPWDDTDLTPGLTLGIPIDPMELLIAIPNISDKLTQFRWFRADVDLEFRMNATPFHIGAVLVSHIPRVENVGVGLYPLKTLSLTQLSQNHGMVMSASSMNNLTLSIDREAATIFDAIDDVNGYTGALGLVTISLLNPLRLASGGSVNPVNIAVFASFRNPKVSGYGYFPLLNPPVEPHSLDVAGEAQNRAAGSITGPEATSLFSPSVVTGTVDTLASLVKSIAPVAQFAMSMGLSKPPNTSTPVPALLDDFRDLNYGHGVNSATKFALHPGAGLGTPSMNGLKKNKISEFIGKPAFLKSTEIDKTDAVDTSLMRFIVHPSLSAYEDGVFSPTPLAYASQSFKRWRGGMKFRFEFITSQFVTARVRLTHWPSPTMPASIETYAGDAVSTVVDIRGDTVVDFTVPYISPFPYQPCRGYVHANADTGWTSLPNAEENSFITLSLVNAMQQPDFSGTACIYVNVYVSAAEDFVFGGLIDPAVRTPLNTTVPLVKPHSLDIAFSKPFKSLVPSTGTYEAGLILPEQYSGIEELCMKYSRFPLVTDVNITSVIAEYDLRSALPLQVTGDSLTFWAVCYRWNRGGLRYKFAMSSPTLPTVSHISFLTCPLNGSTIDFEMICETAQRKTLEAEIPWDLPTYANSYWAGLNADLIANTLGTDYQIVSMPGGTPATINATWRACSDDYMFGHQLAVPTYAYVPPSEVAINERNQRGPAVDMQRKKDPAPVVREKDQIVSLHSDAPFLGATPGMQLPELDQSFGLPDSVREKLAKYLLLKERGKDKTVTSSSQ